MSLVIIRSKLLILGPRSIRLLHLRRPTPLSHPTPRVQVVVVPSNNRHWRRHGQVGPERIVQANVKVRDQRVAARHKDVLHIRRPCE